MSDASFECLNGRCPTWKFTVFGDHHTNCPNCDSAVTSKIDVSMETIEIMRAEIDRLKEYNACLLSDANDMKAMYEAQRLQYILLQEAIHDYNEDQEDKFDIYDECRRIEMYQSAIEINNQLKPQQP